MAGIFLITFFQKFFPFPVYIFLGLFDGPFIARRKAVFKSALEARDLPTDDAILKDADTAFKVFRYP